MNKLTLLIIAVIASVVTAKAVPQQKTDQELIKGFLDDLTAALGQVYNDVLFPAINTQVQNVALLGAQLLAGLSVTGFGEFLGKRDTKGFADFFTDLGNQLYQTLMPTVDTALQTLALTGAQLLAGIAVNGIGRRDEKGFTDFFTDLGNQLYQTLMPTVDSALQSLALTGAQLLAGIAINGIGKRDEKGFTDFFTDLGNQLYQTLLPTVDSALQTLALTGAQLLAGIAINGIGKRDQKGFLDDLTAALGQVYNDVLFPAINTQVQNVALLGAQLLAGLSVTGFADLIGKRDVDMKGFLDDLTAALGQVYNDVLFPAINTQVQNVALLGAQLLAGLSVTGFGEFLGKRDVDMKGFLDDLTAALGQVYNDVLFPAINTQVQNVALLGAQLLAGLSVTGFGEFLGKRDEKGFTDFITDLGNQLYQTLLPTVDSALQSLALTGAQLLAGIAINGIGKRDEKGFTDFISNLGNQLYETLMPTVDSALQSLALTGAQLLAGIAINGIGKRDVDMKGFLDDLTAALGQVYNDVLFPAINTQVQNVALLGAQLLAGLSVTGFGEFLGKRDAKGFTDFITDLGNQLYQTLLPTVDSALQTLALTGAQLLAGIAVNGIGK